MALARPHATVAVPVERASVVLVTDASRLDAADGRRAEPHGGSAQRRGGAFLDGVPDELRVGAVGFSTTPSSVVAPSQDREVLARIWRAFIADGSTATGDALAEALRRLLKSEGKRRPPAAIVLLSDGKTTTGRDRVGRREARGRRRSDLHGRTRHIRRDDHRQQRQHPPRAAGPGDDVEIAGASGGEGFDVDDGEQLDAVYERLGSQIGTRPEQREITAGFAAGGMACCCRRPRSR